MSPLTTAAVPLVPALFGRLFAHEACPSLNKTLPPESLWGDGWLPLPVLTAIHFALFV